MGTQWRTGMGGITGLDYNVLPWLMKLNGVEDEATALTDNASGGVVGRAPMFGLGNNAGAASMAPVIQTTVHVDANGNASSQSEGSGDAMGRALAAEMQNAATQIVQKHIKNGGLIYNFVKGR